MVEREDSRGAYFSKIEYARESFYEYAPLEKAWCPVSGENFLYIYCLWVAGSFKKNGYGKELLEYAIEDCKKQQKKWDLHDFFGKEKALFWRKEIL